jgi:hypothetical protein
MLNNGSMPSCTVIPVLGYPDVGVSEEWGGTTGTI